MFVCFFRNLIEIINDRLLPNYRATSAGFALSRFGDVFTVEPVASGVGFAATFLYAIAQGSERS
jgi:hypothetical protein